MFDPGSKAFKMACVSLYGRSQALNDEEMQSVIQVIKARRALIEANTGDYKLECIKAFGMVDEMELME